MTLDLRDCTVVGPALPEHFLRAELAEQLARLHLLPRPGTSLEHGWSTLRRGLRALGGTSGPLRVHNHVIALLAASLGYAAPQRQEQVATREGAEDGGWLMQSPDGGKLRTWSVDMSHGLDAQRSGGRAFRFSAQRGAARVLLAQAEQAGLLTDGNELRLLLCDPARSASHIAIPLAGAAGWGESRLAPDSYRVLLAIAGPRGIASLPALLDAARLAQARVTHDLRGQARAAVEAFIQGVLDDPANAAALACHTNRDDLARRLWQEGLVVVYRLLFILKLESAGDPARAFNFATATLWREALSPNRALGPLVRRHLDQGHDTGHMLAHGLRSLFSALRDGLHCSELSIAMLGGALFDACSTPLLDTLHWPEHAAAQLLDRLLWTLPQGRARERIQYGPLDVEELGRVYEALLELEPGIATAPMQRLRRGRLENVVAAREATDQTIATGRFYLRTGRNRKATGAYYTPHGFVRYLVHATLAEQLHACSPDDDPDPAAILALKVVDPAIGSGHFLVEACRYLGDALYAACRRCDSLASDAEARAEHAPAAAQADLRQHAASLWARVAALPDPEQALLAYLPSRAREGHATGVSQGRALAICRRMVAVHCLYGVDRNLLAVELAKLSLWLESYAEGLPLTFLDHRVVQGDSLAGASFASLANLPVGGAPLDKLLARGVMQRLAAALQTALRDVRALQATIGRNAADLAMKEQARRRLDEALLPLRQLARAWSGAVMLGGHEVNDEWLALARHVAAGSAWPETATRRQSALLAAGASALPWDLTFPEVFRHDEAGRCTGGFDAVLGNPPWDIVQQHAKEFLAGRDLTILDAPTKREARAQQARLLADPDTAAEFSDYQENFNRLHRIVERLYAHQKVAVGGAPTGGKLDTFRVFAERSWQLAGPAGAIGMLVPSSFHANEGATGIRRLYLEHTAIQTCLSFENQRRLFEINVRQKFALLVARRPGPTQMIDCGFYLDDLARIDDPERILHYDRDFIAQSGGPHLTFLELRSQTDLAIARKLFLGHPSLLDWTQRHGILLGRELNITDDADRLVPVDRVHRFAGGTLLLHEGKTIQQFDDRWDAGPRYAVPLSALRDKPSWCDAARYYRLTLRKIARSTDERTAIAAFTTPGYLFSLMPVERAPQTRGNAVALQLCAIINSFVFDWTLRQKVAVTVNLFILQACPVCTLSDDAARFLAHGALRLSCNHAGYAPLWREQLGGTWRETSSRHAWPAIAGDARWQLRAAVDAIVAQAYGLNRADYAAILASFAHRSRGDAPALCLGAFDALNERGPAAFCRAHDPYDDIALVTAPAMPCQSQPHLSAA